MPLPGRRLRQDPGDRVLTPALLLLGLAWLLLIRLDAVRFHSSEMPVLLQVLGAGTPLLLGSWFGLFIPHVW